MGVFVFRRVQSELAEFLAYLCSCILVQTNKLIKYSQPWHRQMEHFVQKPLHTFVCHAAAYNSQIHFSGCGLSALLVKINNCSLSRVCPTHEPSWTFLCSHCVQTALTDTRRPLQAKFLHQSVVSYTLTLSVFKVTSLKLITSLHRFFPVTTLFFL